MDNQHQKIKGYRDLTQEEIDLMNRVKEKGDELGALCKELSENIHAAYREKYQAAMDSTTKDAYGAPIHTDTDECDELARFNNADPKRWVSIGKTELQKGIMSLIRAIAQPTTF